MTATHLDRATCEHSKAFWCGRYAPSEPSTKWAPGATCVPCLQAALAEARRLRDHYLDEMNAARARLSRAWTTKKEGEL